jgi:hypothetical protein
MEGGGVNDISDERYPMFGEDWRRRWLVLPSWNRLHRVASIEWDEDYGDTAGAGTTACGRKGMLHIPGIFSRMSLERCAHCCRIIGIPVGDGAPANSGIEEPPQ